MTEQELVRRFHQALTDISTLAEAIGELHWKRAFFDKAARTLENESMPFEERLQLACEQSHVFGGMGSWNDSPRSPPTNTACLMNLKRPLRLCMKYVRRQWRI